MGLLGWTTELLRQGGLSREIDTRLEAILPGVVEQLKADPQQCALVSVVIFSAKSEGQTMSYVYRVGFDGVGDNAVNAYVSYWKNILKGDTVGESPREGFSYDENESFVYCFSLKEGELVSGMIPMVTLSPEINAAIEKLEREEKAAKEHQLQMQRVHQAQSMERLKREEEARRQQDLARRHAEGEMRRQQELARRRAEEEVRHQQELARRRAEEEARHQQELRQRLEEASRRDMEMMRSRNEQLQLQLQEANRREMEWKEAQRISQPVYGTGQGTFQWQLPPSRATPTFNFP